MKIQSRLNILTEHFHQWWRLDGRQNAAADIVEAIDKLGYTDTLLELGIHFTGDRRVNAQKLYRWLGFYPESKINYEHILDMEVVIVAAMPEKVRLSYLQEVYLPTDVLVSPACRVEPDTQCFEIDLQRALTIMIKEDAESQVAMLNLNNNETCARLLKTVEKELVEAIAIKSTALETVRYHMELLHNEAA